MSWEARGMAIDLMALGNFEEHMGTLPVEDDLWRTTLGIPTQRVINAALKKTVQGRGMREQNELDIVWKDVWKVELLRWFVLIDDEFLIKRPQYFSCKGRYWHPLLDDINVQQPAPHKKSKKIASGDGQDISKPKKSGVKKKAGAKVLDSEWDFPVIRYTERALKSCWDIPMTSDTRSSLWSNALSILAIPGDPASEASGRQFLGKLIKDFGEKNVATAVAQLMVRAVKPADPKAFLRKQMQHAEEGSPAVQKARAQRVKVPL